MKIRQLFFVAILFYLLQGSNAFAEGAFKIGWIGPLTGDAAVLGVDSAEAVSMVVDSINKDGGIHGTRVELFLEDDRYETRRTVEAYKKLVHGKDVKILFVISYGGLFATSPMAQQDGVVLLDPLDCNEDIAALPENTFCVSQMTEAIGRSNAERAVTRGDVPAGIIYFANDPFMGTLAQTTVKRMRELGSEPAYLESYSAHDADFRSLLIKAKRRGVRSLFFYGYDDLGNGMRQARELGLEVPFYATATITSPGHQATAGSAAHGTTVSVWKAPRTAEYQEFLRQFYQRSGREPSLEISTVPSYDLAQIIIEAFSTAEPDSSALVAQLKKRLYALSDYHGLSGLISMSPDGAVRTLKVRVWQFDQGRLQ